jgi:hypothetical protein
MQDKCRNCDKKPVCDFIVCHVELDSQAPSEAALAGDHREG